MAVLTCDVCGGNLSMDASGDFAVCESCGMKHTKDRIKTKPQEIKGSSAEPARTADNYVPQVIPKRFTNKFIQDEIIKLTSLISECDTLIERARYDKAHFYEEYDKKLRNEIQIELIKDSKNIAQYGPLRNVVIESLNKQRNDNNNYIIRYIEENEEKKSEYERKKYQLNALSRKTVEQRMEEHYQSLINEKCTANDAEQLSELCKEFREMGGYKNTAELADECDNQYRVLKERREEQERIARERWEERERKERAERERREEQERQEREERKEREEEERKRRKKKQRFWIIFSILLGGIVGGSIFGFGFAYFDENVVEDWSPVFMVALGILGLCGGCWGGVIGVVIGGLISMPIDAWGTPYMVVLGITVGALIGWEIGKAKNK